MPLLFRISPFFFFKKHDVTESHYGPTISSRSSLRVPEQVDDQGMRDAKGVHTIRVPVITSRRVQRGC